MQTSTFEPIFDAQHIKNEYVIHPPATIAVIGAGVFGVWAALFLRRQGFKVFLIDAWGAGNSLSSSGDETRVTRCMYGANELYLNLAKESQEIWRQASKPIYHQTGVLWLLHEAHNAFVETSLTLLEKNNLPYRRYSPEELAVRFPLISTEGLHSAIFEVQAGYLKAREGCQTILKRFIVEGGTFINNQVVKTETVNGIMQRIEFADGKKLTADAFVFACGAWLPQLFPEILGSFIVPTRQEAYYFRYPARYAADFEQLPVWIDWNGGDSFYGIPYSDWRGFKVACDTRGEVINPTEMERLPTAEKVEKAREFVAHRFPEMKNAPLIESRVCQYENSPDGNILFDTHPEAQNTWFLGGGSGHGFKLAPALGSLVAKVLVGKSLLPTILRREK